METFHAETIKTKDLTFDIFSKFICQAERQSRKKLKYLYINFNRKFANKTFEKYTVKEGIK